MQKDLQKIAGAAANIKKADPAARIKYMAGLQAATQDQEEAARAKEAAETEKEFDAARDREDRAKEKAAFFKKQLEKLTFSPRMDEAEYYKHLETADKVITESVQRFINIALPAMDQIIAAQKECLQTAADADQVLEALDISANVLQVKYRYKKHEYIGREPDYIEDRFEWRNHAQRYSDGEPYRRILDTDPESKKILAAAWNAATKATRRL